MAGSNATGVTEFILLGFAVQREVEIILFLLILVVYSLTLVGNVGMISLISMDSRLSHSHVLFPQ